jgi:hypothetical protein
VTHYMAGGRLPKGRLSYFAGLDIGQLSDYTALAIMERVYKHEEHLDVDTQVEHRLVHLDRFELGTPYPEVVEKLGEFLARPPLAGRTRLAVDATGVGARRLPGPKEGSTTREGGSACPHHRWGYGEPGERNLPRAQT